MKVQCGVAALAFLSAVLFVYVGNYGAAIWAFNAGAFALLWGYETRS